MSTLYRIGIDVGGTFTHAVAIEAASQKLIGKVKVSTTHYSTRGVGEGVVGSLQALMSKCSISAQQIAIVAHSTTQATNSLLEGDVEKVGIVSVGSGIHGFLTRKSAALGKIQLSPGKFLETASHHIDSGDSKYNERLDQYLEECITAKIRVLVVASAFSVEDPAEEKAVADYLRTRGFLVTATHEVSQLFGVAVRVRTTAINASILPKMMEVADHTEREIRAIGITAPFMIMRSDGGVMSVDEMRKKPILTLLSGPAAGIAAALRYLKITDGVFLEVGGTSTDISVIKNGRAITRSATIGGNKTFLKTLDCRTLGVGGGSIPRVTNGRVVDIGPRSAHIAGVSYAAFSGSAPLADLARKFVQPRAGDPSDYLIFQNGEGTLRLGFTPTCAANLVGLVPEGDCAKALPAFADDWKSQKDLAAQILDRASQKTQGTVEALLREYQMERGWTKLIGGGGGASALVPHLAQKMGLEFEIARDADVISAIGVALGLIREVVEKSCLNPTAEEIFRLRTEAREKVLSQGASPNTIEVFIEIDAKKNLIRAEAQGSIEFKNENQKIINIALSPVQIGAEIKKALALRDEPTHIMRAQSSSLSADLFEVRTKKFFGLSTLMTHPVVVTDLRGVFRLKLRSGNVVASTAGTIAGALNDQIPKHTLYGDGGVDYPFVYALLADRIVDLSKLNTPEQIRAVLEIEASEIPASDPAVLIFTRHLNEEQDS